MSEIFEALPGIEAPVDSISRGLAGMWASHASEGRPSPGSEHAKATQVNFVLHLGLRTDAADAVRQFEVAVRFSRRYPCRVVVLCPLGEDSKEEDMRAKVYGECTIGKTKDDTRCCEFVMLSYPRAARTFLESQVSICLSTDIPLYYWAHRFSDPSKLADYRYLLTTAKRVLIDSATAPEGAIAYPWPRPENVRDLAFARLLPVRQAIGQFLSRYPVQSIAGGLREITLAHGAGVAAEARVLFEWIKARVEACGASGEGIRIAPSARLAPTGLALEFTYVDRRRFSWTANLAAGRSTFNADFGGGRTSMPAAVSLLPQENALSEAMFF
jgi:Glucose-6-phosphate dehydrogenase subunit